MNVARQCGFSMMESLIAVFVLSVGILGIAVLQLQSKHVNYQAVQRFSASMLAHEIIEKMRNNSLALDNYVATVGGGTISTAPTPVCTPPNVCTPQQLAAYDLWQWERTLDGAEELAGTVDTGGLSEPTGCIVGPAGGGNGAYTITVAWRGMRGKDDPNENPCGKASGKYNDELGNSAFRRLLTVNAYILGPTT